MALVKGILDGVFSVFHSEEIGNLSSIRMVEFGAQYIRISKVKRKIKSKFAKHYFEHLGVLEYVSLDIIDYGTNVIFDLRTVIPVDFVGRFNVVMNFGTSEHVGDRNSQISVFRNADSLCADLGYMFHAVPLVGTWKGHGLCYYTRGFFKYLCEGSKYRMVRLYIIDFPPKKKMFIRKLIFCCMQKLPGSSFLGNDLSNISTFLSLLHDS